MRLCRWVRSLFHRLAGERIKLNADTMRMLFEVKDLSKASPATVSRCGMVYLPEAVTGWRLMMQSWLACLDHHVSSQDKQVSIHETVPPCSFAVSRPVSCA